MSGPFDYFAQVLGHAMPGATDNAPASSPSTRAAVSVYNRPTRFTNLPQPGEGFAAYNARQGGALAGIAGNRTPEPALRRARTARNFSRVRQLETATPPIGPLHAMGEEAVREANVGSDTRLLDIPLGVTLQRPGISPGRNPVRTFQLRVRPPPAEPGVPGVATAQAARAQVPDAGIRLIRWGVDLRRTPAEVIGDVERMTGAPTGYLTNVMGREIANRPLDVVAPTSSAAGPFQITQGTWNGYVTDPTPFSQRFRDAYGFVPTMGTEERAGYKGDLRVDGAIAAEIARSAFARYKSAGMATVTQKDLYMSHFGGGAGEALAIDHSRGQYAHPFAKDYFSREAVEANLPNFFHPVLRDGHVVRETRINARGEHYQQIIVNRRQPYTAAEMYDMHTSQFPDTAVTFGKRANGSDDPLDAPGVR